MPRPDLTSAAVTRFANPPWMCFGNQLMFGAVLMHDKFEGFNAAKNFLCVVDRLALGMRFFTAPSCSLHGR